MQILKLLSHNKKFSVKAAFRDDRIIQLGKSKVFPNFFSKFAYLKVQTIWKYKPTTSDASR